MINVPVDRNADVVIAITSQNCKWDFNLDGAKSKALNQILFYYYFYYK